MGEDKDFCPFRMKDVASEHGDFPKIHFWELVFGTWFLGTSVKWAFLFPKKKKGKMLYRGCYLLFGDNDSFLGNDLTVKFLNS